MGNFTNKIFKPKKCKCCKEGFTPERNLQYLCSPKCAVVYLNNQRAKKRATDWKIKKKVMKENIKSLSDYKKDLQVEINSIARLIDTGCSCISCGKNGKAQAGHYHSTGANSTLRFNLHNIHIQDYRCNVELSSNIIGYNAGLIEVYGKEYKEYIETNIKLMYEYIKLNKEDLIECIFKAKNLRKNLEKHINEWELPLPPRIRKRLRDQFNEQIGIYT